MVVMNELNDDALSIGYGMIYVMTMFEQVRKIPDLVDHEHKV